MASERGAQQAGSHRWLELLRSQGLGFVCGQLTVILLAVGSLVITRTRDGLSKELQLDAIRPFFKSPHLVHSWFYLLILVLTVFAINTLLCTWDSVLRRWRAGQRSPWHYGPALIHIAFLFGLLAHLVGGLYGKEHRPVLIGGSWQQLSDGRQARLLELAEAHYPNGQLRQIQARVQLKAVDGTPSEQLVSYNGPLSDGWGAKLWLLARQGRRWTAQFSRGPDSCAAGQRQRCTLGSLALYVTGIYPEGHWGKIPAVRLLLVTAKGREQFFILAGRTHRLPDGSQLKLDTVKQLPYILLRQREAPGNPWALLASLLLLLGCILMGRRWVLTS